MDEQPRNVEELLLNDSFIRWARGLSDNRETAFWEQWVTQDPINKELAEEAKNVLKAMRFKRVDTSDVEGELEKLNTSINSKIPLEKTHGSGLRRDKVYQYLSAAAIALIIFSAGFFVLNQQFDFSTDQQAAVPIQTKIQQQVIKANQDRVDQTDKKRATDKLSTGYAEKSTLIFDDGSKVVLNAKSTLEYPTGNTENGDIKVRLEGEAYFDIAERKPKNKRTFTVQTKDGSVNVLGTKFSVRSKNENTKVALKQGVVEVHAKGAKIEKNYKMKPGELAQFSKMGNSIEIAEINTEVYFSWTENKLRFDNTPLSEIVDRIEQTYGVNVTVEDQSLMNKKISGSIQNNDLDVLLKALSELLQTPTPIKRQRSTITIDT